MKHLFKPLKAFKHKLLVGLAKNTGIGKQELFREMHRNLPLWEKLFKQANDDLKLRKLLVCGEFYGEHYIFGDQESRAIFGRVRRAGKYEDFKERFRDYFNPEEKVMEIHVFKTNRENLLNSIKEINEKINSGWFKKEKIKGIHFRTTNRKLLTHFRRFAGREGIKAKEIEFPETKTETGESKIVFMFRV